MAEIKQLSNKFESMIVLQLSFVGILVGTFLSTIFIPDTNTPQNHAGLYLIVVLFGSVAVFSGFGLWVYLRTSRWLTKRSKNLLLYAAANGLHITPYTLSAHQYVSPTLYSFGTRNQFFANCVGKDNWQFGDYSFAIYRRNKYGEYKERTVYYSVFSMQLPRVLPNVFFDSKATRGSEFRKLFDDSQLHSLEGNFDKYFHTYFPTYYTIDSLSFISPEVMQALIEAKDFDIEINGNKLYLYQPIKKMPQQLEHAYLCANKVYMALMNNINTYRDERLDFVEGRKGVSVAGIRLRRGLVRHYIKMFFAFLLTAIGLGFAVIPNPIHDSSFPYYALGIGIVMLFTSAKYIYNERALRKAADAAQKTYEKSKNMSKDN